MQNNPLPWNGASPLITCLNNVGNSSWGRGNRSHCNHQIIGISIHEQEHAQFMSLCHLLHFFFGFFNIFLSPEELGQTVTEETNHHKWGKVNRSPKPCSLGKNVQISVESLHIMNHGLLLCHQGEKCHIYHLMQLKANLAILRIWDACFWWDTSFPQPISPVLQKGSNFPALLHRFRITFICKQSFLADKSCSVTESNSALPEWTSKVLVS